MDKLKKIFRKNYNYRSLYNVAGLQFVFPEPIISGDYKLVKNEEEETNQNLLKLKISSNGEAI